MNIHHYYSILSLLKFERTTEREKKGKKKERKRESAAASNFSARFRGKIPEI